MDMMMPIHEVDRRLYMILALQLCFNPREALRIIAFWIYLGHLGFRNPVKAILMLPIAQIRLMADEAITCLNYLSGRAILSSPQVSDLPLTRSVISEVISLQFLGQYRSNIITGIREVTHSVCNLALMDILQEAEKRNAARNSAETDRMIASLPDPESLICGEGFLTLPSVHPDDRTLFVTFSHGYPVAEKELCDFFTRYYDVSVESVHMQLVKPGQQSLHARVVFHSPDIIGNILSGEERAKFMINGKHAWMRKFVPKCLSGLASR